MMNKNKNNMKKILFVVAAVIACSFASCTGQNHSEEDNLMDSVIVELPDSLEYDL